MALTVIDQANSSFCNENLSWVQSPFGCWLVVDINTVIICLNDFNVLVLDIKVVVTCLDLFHMHMTSNVWKTFLNGLVGLKMQLVLNGETQYV